MIEHAFRASAKALDQNSSFIEALLEQLDELFITEQL